MKKTSIFLILFLLVFASKTTIQAQTVQGDLFKLTQKNALIDEWNIQYVNLNQLEFSLNGTQSILRLDNLNTTVETPLIVNQNVGIGTSNPTEALTISSGFGRADGFIVYGSSSTQSDWNAPWYGISRGDESQLDFLSHINNSNPVVVQGFYGLAFRTRDGVMAMDDDGVVSIGLDANRMMQLANNTTSFEPFKLFVNGGIRTEEVQIDLETNWPDYVFAENYNLRPLSEVETFIQENHHLPDVPSAQEVENNGILVGEMNATLLKKVEELTLYVIELEKKIAKMEKQSIQE